MKIVSIFKYDASKNAVPTQEDQQRMGALIGEMMGAGVLVDTGGVMPTSVSFRVRRTAADYSVTDGPFAESIEVTSV